MISCPGCGAGMRFDIESQMMKCNHCGQMLLPDYFESMTKDAEESRFFDATIYTCAGCGAELMTAETTEATAYCPWCGNTSVLFGRLRSIKYPKYIIPFGLTKEECKQAYLREAKRAIFTPYKYKKAEFVDSFRGIYMPYWSYRVEQKGIAHVKAESKPEQDGPENIVKEYEVNCKIDMAYDGYTHDASTAFDDEISECLEPFDLQNRKLFTPGYLSGFYADVADENEQKYRDDAVSYFEKKTAEKLINGKDSITTKKGTLYPTGIQDVSIPTTEITIDQVLQPVWFMSYRKGDRITYAAVNGQTGKVVADFPISPLRFLLAVLLSTAVLFVGLNLVFTLKPEWALLITTVLMIIGIISVEQPYRGLTEQERDGPRRKKLLLSIVCLLAGMLALRLIDNGTLLFFAVVILLLDIPGIKKAYARYLERKKERLNNQSDVFRLHPFLKVVYWAMIVMAIFVWASGQVHNRDYYVVSFMEAAVVLVAIFQCFGHQMKLARRRPPQMNRRDADENE